MCDMTPSEARKILDDSFLHLTEIEMYLYLERALETIANMHTEEDYRETVRYERIVSKWQEVPRD